MPKNIILYINNIGDIAKLLLTGCELKIPMEAALRFFLFPFLMCT